LGVAGTAKVWGGKSAGERQELRRLGFIEAGLTLFASKGYPSTTVLDICREAKLSQRYLYEIFGGVPGLFDAVLRDLVATADATVRSAVQQCEGNAKERVRAGIDALVGALTDDPRRARVALVASLASEGSRARRRTNLLAFRDLAVTLLDELYGPSPRSAERRQVAMTVMIGGVGDALVAWVDGGLQVTRDELVDEVVSMLDCVGSRHSP
jgi:AcrR family transcriptional regulator